MTQITQMAQISMTWIKPQAADCAEGYAQEKSVKSESIRVMR